MVDTDLAHELIQTTVTEIPTTWLTSLSAMRSRLHHSPDPGEVFSSVAEICVSMGYGCTVVLTNDDGRALRIERPSGVAVTTSPADPLIDLLDVTPLLVLAHDAIGISIVGPQFRGGLVSRALQSDPSYADALVLRLLVDEAIAVLTRERLRQELAAEQERAANLTQALASNREIGMAMGFIMSSENLNAQAAFERLRSMSQRSNRKIRDIAAEVISTATVPPVAPEPDPDAQSPSRRIRRARAAAAGAATAVS